MNKTKEYTYKHCGAKTRAGGKCKQRAMKNGKCYTHGGKSVSGIASLNFKTGLHSKYLPKKLQERYNAALENPDLLNLKHDVALIRTLTNEQLSQMEQGNDSNPAWVEVYEATAYL